MREGIGHKYGDLQLFLRIYLQGLRRERRASRQLRTGSTAVHTRSASERELTRALGMAHILGLILRRYFSMSDCRRCQLTSRCRSGGYIDGAPEDAPQRILPCAHRHTERLTLRALAWRCFKLLMSRSSMKHYTMPIPARCRHVLRKL